MVWSEEPSGGGGGMFVRVMTDEQMEVLRKQIAVHATISEQLVQWHKSLTSQHDFAGVRMGNLYCDPALGATGRQRWSPTPKQLQILERIFDLQGIVTPSKQKIKEITSDLTQHGHISEANVYNWFQNRRARSKRKKQQVESSSNEKKTKPPDQQIIDSARRSKPEPMLMLPPTNFGHIPNFYGNILSNPRMEQFTGKIEVPGNYNPYLQKDYYHKDG